MVKCQKKKSKCPVCRDQISHRSFHHSEYLSLILDKMHKFKDENLPEEEKFDIKKFLFKPPKMIKK